MGTVINLRAGGSTPVSGALRALVVLVVLALLLGLGRYVEPIPHAVLAGILMKVGWDIIDWRMIARVHRMRREHLFVMLLTLGLTVFVDLVTAVAIGLIAAGMAHARQLERMELDSVVSVPLLDLAFLSEQVGAGADPFSARVGLVALRGSFTVASSHKLVGVISDDIKDHEVVIFDFADATYIDDSAAMLIHQLIEVATHEHTHRGRGSEPGRVGRRHARCARRARRGAGGSNCRNARRRAAHRLPADRGTFGRRRRGAQLTRVLPRGLRYWSCSNCSTREPNTCSACSTGAGLLMSTPASRSDSIG